MKTKRFIAFCVAIICLIAQFSLPVMAEENDIVSDHAEIIYFDDIPVGVSINEAVELAKRYDTDEAPAFINGFLNSVARSLGDSQK